MGTRLDRKIHPSPHRNVALFWAVAGALTALAVLPYALALNPQAAEELPLAVLVVGQPLQTFALIFLGGWLGLRLGEEIGLDSPFARSLVHGRPMPDHSRRRFGLAVALGVAAGLAILALERYVFGPLLPPAKSDLAQGAALWKGLLGALYGGIAEELLTRLVVMTGVTWALWRIAGRGRRPVPPWVYWTGIVVASLAFGLGHLPVAAGIWQLVPIVVVRTVALNLVGAVGFGYLYWRWGLEHAMVAHFVADVVLRSVGM